MRLHIFGFPALIPRSFSLYPSLYFRILNVTLASALHHVESEFRCMVGKSGYVSSQQLANLGQLTGADLIAKAARVLDLFSVDITHSQVAANRLG